MILVAHHMYCDNLSCYLHENCEDDRTCDAAWLCRAEHRDRGWFFARWSGREWHFCSAECKEQWRQTRDIQSNDQIAALADVAGNTSRGSG